MGGWICFAVCLLPSYFFYKSGHMILMTIAIVNAAINFWSFGIMYNYAVHRNSQWAETIRKNRELEGQLSDEDEDRLNKIGSVMRPEDAPDWLTWINMLTSLVGLIFLVLCWFLR